MGLPRLFKLPRNKQFNYQPLYYNPDKEARAEREKRLSIELGIEGSNKKSLITRGSMRDYFQREKKVRKQSNLRLIIIVAILFFIAYLLLFR